MTDFLNFEDIVKSTDWIVDKIKSSDAYAQNFYAALCNNVIAPDCIFDILKENYYSCSWRYAGGMVSEIRQSGDYLDWYCSGMTQHNENMDEPRHTVPESFVTDEIREDFKLLGFRIINRDAE